MKTLHLQLKSKWYHLIESGIKTEEYRLIIPHWDTRLSHSFDTVEFSLGYPRRDDWSRRMLFELKEIAIGRGKVDWGAPANEDVYIIKLGRKIK